MPEKSTSNRPFYAFEPRMLMGLHNAFDEACALIPEQPISEASKDFLALTINDLSREGMTDLGQLRDEAVAGFKRKMPAATK